LREIALNEGGKGTKRTGRKGKGRERRGYGGKGKEKREKESHALEFCQLESSVQITTSPMHC